MTQPLADRLRVQCIVTDYATAHTAVQEGATAIQLRLKGAATDEVVHRGEPMRRLHALFIVNDDARAALELHADGVHLGDEDIGAERALTAGLIVGRSASHPDDAIELARNGATYIGCGPIWTTPTKLDAGEAIGVDGLAAVCRAVSIPVVAIGGVDETNAGSCIRAGAAGVAVVR
ncbi:MAG TPA: thiamine phosphate synthase, partial [Candidatus Dormibacteraeota bacterium]|nr:thiamine phosphate synthase [Candidatus Dormibacteraeota bacterium]